MDFDRFSRLDLSQLPSPCFVVDEGLLAKNLKKFEQVKQATGCKILLALKGFAMFSTFDLLKTTLDGVCASSPHEARLGREEFGKEVHAFAPAYSPADVEELIQTCDHILFNSLAQWRRYRDQIPSHLQCGLRINPGYAEVEVEIYNPCAPGSRLGMTEKALAALTAEDWQGIRGLHFHALCEQNSDTLERVLQRVEAKFGQHLGRMDWLNFGGGHHVTRADYDLDLLIRLINQIQDKYGLQVILEPGEAVALNTGILLATVLDLVENDCQIAVLDTSAEAHMPDVLAMPYRPEIHRAGQPGEKPHTYRLAGVTCLAGDVVGDYAFDQPLQVGDRLLFGDMGHYSMVKTTTFNGIALPSIAKLDQAGRVHLVRRFGYQDFKSRLS